MSELLTLADVFPAHERERYKKLYIRLAHDIQAANASMCVLDWLVEFPIHLLHSEHTVFFSLLYRNYGRQVVLAVLSATDSSGKALSLHTLKRFTKERSNDGVTDPVQKLLRTTRVPETDVYERAKTLRDKAFAHTDQSGTDKKVTNPELKSLLTQVTGALKKLSFGIELELEPGCNPLGEEPQSYIDTFFHWLASQSHLLQSKELLHQKFKNINAQDQAKINSCRQFLGLPTINFDHPLKGQESSIHCSHCDFPLAEDHTGVCPKCGKTGRTVSVGTATETDTAGGISWEKRFEYYKKHKKMATLATSLSILSLILSVTGLGLVVGLPVGIIAFLITFFVFEKKIKISRG